MLCLVMLGVTFFIMLSFVAPSFNSSTGDMTIRQNDIQKNNVLSVTSLLAECRFYLKIIRLPHRDHTTQQQACINEA